MNMNNEYEKEILYNIIRDKLEIFLDICVHSDDYGCSYYTMNELYSEDDTEEGALCEYNSLIDDIVNCLSEELLNNEFIKINKK